MPPEERRAAIIAAATPLVCDRGAAVTSKEIAEAAGIAEGTIFRVFPDKDAVIRAVVAQILDPGPYVEALRRIDPNQSLEGILRQAVDAMRQRLESVWQIMWMLRIGGPPGNSRDQSKYAPAARPDLTRANDALADLLVPHRDRLRLPPIEAVRMFRLVTFSSAHPAITDGQVLSTQEIVDLLLHGIGVHPDPGRPRSDFATDTVIHDVSRTEEVGVM
jgi:AcrR family transcriptional regulator